VAAPMTASAASDTAMIGIRLEASCGAASGAWSACVSLSGASVTYRSLRLKPSREILPIAARQNKTAIKQTSHGGDKPAMARARLPTRIRLKSWARMVNDRLVLMRAGKVERLVRRSSAGEGGSDTSLQRPKLAPRSQGAVDTGDSGRLLLPQHVLERAIKLHVDTGSGIARRRGCGSPAPRGGPHRQRAKQPG